MNWLRHILALILIVALLVWRFTSGPPSRGTATSYPDKPIHVVVPYPQGGGTDNFARLLGRKLTDKNWIDEPLVFLNQPGGSGTIGSRYVKDARPDGYRILCHHESLITAQLSGAANFGPDDFKPIAQTGNIVLLVVVRKDAPYQSIKDLLIAAAESPRTIRFGANTGSPAHFTAMKLEAANPGAEFNLVTAGGGQTRYNSLVGGHLDAGIFSLAEFISFQSPEGTAPEKDIRALVILSEKRHPDHPDIPTCVEHDIEVTSNNAYYWWAPRKTPELIVRKLAAALQKGMNDPYVQAQLKQWSIGTEFTSGEALSKKLQERAAAIKPPKMKKRISLPNFPRYALIITCLLGMIALYRTLRRAPVVSEEKTSAVTGFLCFTVLFLYVFALGKEVIPFALLTILMVFSMGVLICRFKPAKLLPLVEIAVITGLGSEFIFTRFFSVALP